MSNPEHPPWRSHVVGLLLHPQQPRIWLQAAPDGFALPQAEIADYVWTASAGIVQSTLEPLLRQPLHVLNCVQFAANGDTRQVEAAFLLEATDNQTPAHGNWVDRDTLETLPLSQPQYRPLIQDTLAEAAARSYPPLRAPWAKPGWHASMRAWLETELERLGMGPVQALQPVKSWPLSCLLQVTTAAGCFYFKATATLPLFVNEGQVMTALARWFPHNVPAPLVTEPAQNWMLLPDLGTALPWAAPPAARQRLQQLFGQRQRESVALLPDLLAAGCLDRRLPVLARQLGTLLADPVLFEVLPAAEATRLQALLPALQNACAELASYHVPAALVHGDLHTANVILQGETMVIIDWTDACITHPFFDMLTIFWEEDAALKAVMRDDYLSLWTEYEPMPRLRQAWELAEWLGAAHQAVSYQQILAHIEPGPGQALRHDFRQWLQTLLALGAGRK